MANHPDLPMTKFVLLISRLIIDYWIVITNSSSGSVPTLRTITGLEPQKDKA